MGLQTEKDKEKEDQKRNFKICSKKFETDELEVLKKIFKELGSRSASNQIDKETFLQFFPLPGLWGERLFLKFNFKNTGYIDFEEFIIGIAICCRGTKSDKISVLFDIFDLNSDGYIQKSEMVAMLSNIPYIDKLKSIFFNKKNRKKKNSYDGENNSNENSHDKTEGEGYENKDQVENEDCNEGHNGEYPEGYHYGEIYGYSNVDQDGDEEDSNYSNSYKDDAYSENDDADDDLDDGEEDNEEDLNDNDEASCHEGHVSATVVGGIDASGSVLGTNDAAANSVTNCSKCLKQQRRMRNRKKLLNMRELAKKIRKEKKHQLERCMKGIRDGRYEESNSFSGVERKCMKEKEKNKSPKKDSIFKSESDDNINTSSSSTSNGFTNEEMDHSNVSKKKSLRSRIKRKGSRYLANFKSGNNHDEFMSSTSDSCTSNDTNSFPSSEEVDSFNSNKEQRNGGDSNTSSSTEDSFISIYGYLIKNKQPRRKKKGLPDKGVDQAGDKLLADRTVEQGDDREKDNGQEKNTLEGRNELVQEQIACTQGGDAEADGAENANEDAQSEEQTKALNEETESAGGVVKKGKKRTCLNNRSDMNIYKKEKKKETKRKLFLHEYCLPSKTARNILHDEESYDMQEKNVDVEEIVDRMLEECEFWDNDKITPIQFKSVIYKYDFFLYVFFSCLHEDIWGLQGNVLYGRDYISNFVIKSENFKSKQIDENEEVITEEVYFKIRQLFIIQAPDYNCLNDNLCVNFLKGEQGSGHQGGSDHQGVSDHEGGASADGDKDKSDLGASKNKAKVDNGSKLVNFALPTGEETTGVVAGVVDGTGIRVDQEEHASVQGGDVGNAELCAVVTGRSPVEGHEKREAIIPSSENVVNTTSVMDGVDAALEPPPSKQSESPQQKKEETNVDQPCEEEVSAAKVSEASGNSHVVQKIDESEEKKRLDGKKKIAECFNAVLRQKGVHEVDPGKGGNKDGEKDSDEKMIVGREDMKNKAGYECDFNLLTNSLNDIFSKEIVEFIKASRTSFNINEVWKERNAHCKDKYKKAKRNIDKTRNYSNSAHCMKKRKKPLVNTGLCVEGVNAVEGPPPVNEAIEINPSSVEIQNLEKVDLQGTLGVLGRQAEATVKEEAVEMPADVPGEVPAAAATEGHCHNHHAHEGKKKKKHVKDVNLYSCPNCKGPFLMCPNCHGRYPRFCVNEDKIAMECEYCECEHCYFYKCIYCNFDFQKCLDMIKKNSLKEGILYKIGKHLHQFKARYYILFDNLLYYYDKQKNLKPRGFMFLEGCYVEVISKNDHINKFGFSICHKGTNHVQRRNLYVNTYEEREEWLQALYSTTKQNTLYNLYELHEQLGQGKFSTVYRGINKQTNSEFAIKVIDKRSVSIYEKELLRSEISILRLLRHPNVIYLKEIINTKETLYISMELVKGGELYDFLLTETRLSEIHANKIITQLIKTVAYLHRCGIIHRDIKPENILLTDKSRDAQIKLTDFGLSTLCAPNELLKEPCGTLAYVAPEVITLQGYNHKVDAWSIGIILYLLLSGKLPFPISKNTEMNVQKNYVLTFKDHVWKSISSSAKDLISKLLELNVEKRISANEALEHIWIKNPTAVINENSFIYKNEEINILNLQDVSVSTFNIPRYAPFHLEEEKTEEVENKNVFSFHEEDIMYEKNDSADEPVIPLPYSGAPLKDSATDKNTITPSKEISFTKEEAPTKEENPISGDAKGEELLAEAQNGDQPEEQAPCEGQQTAEKTPIEYATEEGGGGHPVRSFTSPPG